EIDRAKFEQMLQDVASVSPDDPGSETRAIVSLAELFDGTDYLIFGQAFSANGGELHGLQIATARVELRIIDLRTRKTVLVERQSASAPDLNQASAGKTALQRAGRRAGLAALPKWVAMQPKRQG